MEEKCDICYEDLKTFCTFICKHRLCLDCFLQYIEEKQECHICRTAINRKLLKVNGGNDTLFFKTTMGTMETFSTLDLNELTCMQLYKLVSYKIYGTYLDDLRLIYSGRILPKNNIIIKEKHIENYSTIHCVINLRGD